jgi:eukaryotic-like serine/threonine-protein kinase
VSTSERWQDVERLYHEALRRGPSDRASYLNEACRGDETLRHDVESLLAYSHDSEYFLSPPAVDQLAGLEAFAAPAQPSLTGQRFGPYEITALLGSGGMGQVYRARDVKLGRDVAIKILPGAFLDDADRRARFEREARVLASLNHPHIGSTSSVRAARRPSSFLSRPTSAAAWRRT